ncbi:MAG: hydantoinase/oxoprolinase family protein [Roseiflexaceae bacterium]
MSVANLRLGIDVGGTNTDAVVLDPAGQLLAHFKAPTTADVTGGIRAAIHGLVNHFPTLDLQQIGYAMLGTTHCTNALIERRQLNRVGLIRIGAPATLAIPPYTTWPPDLLDAIGRHAVVVGGGYEYDGRETCPLDRQAVLAALHQFAGQVESIAISCSFATVNPAQEREVGAMVCSVLGDATPITYSHEIGSVGLLERENATALNAALMHAAQVAAAGFADALTAHGIRAQRFFSQNDGTLMALEYAMRFPILTVASGPTNSIRGAAFLSGLKDAIVVDVGGTTTDVGVLVAGFPREAAIAIEVGGVRTNFRSPDLLSVALGGGTRVHREMPLRIGPTSVGYRLTEQARVFGGSELTLSDIAVAAGQLNLGNPALLADLPADLVEQVLDLVRQRCDDAIDRVRTSAELLPIILVGGGSAIIPAGIADGALVYRPAHYDVANAIGAAIAQCSGEVERIFALDQISRHDALEQARHLACAEAIQAGADPATIEIIDIQEVPLAYLPGSATRIRVRAAGNLQLDRPMQPGGGAL